MFSESVKISARKIGESSANVTYGVQLSELTSLFNSLSDEEKTKAFIKSGNTIFNINDIRGNFVYSVCTSAEIQIFSLFLTNSTAYQYYSSSVHNQTNVTNTTKLELYVN